jgi:hypothetical protein
MPQQNQAADKVKHSEKVFSVTLIPHDHAPKIGNQPIKNFPLVVTQISRSMTRMFVDATTGACG